MNSTSWGSAYFDAINQFEKKYKLPAGTLYTISKLETSHRPWTLNVNGIAVYLQSQNQLIYALREISNKPFYFQSNDNFHNFHKTEELAKQAALKLNVPFSKIQKLNIKSTDICGTQLNYYWNEASFNNVIEMTDIHKCLERSAQLLKNHINTHGFEVGVACYHNCDQKSDFHRIYKRKFLNEYRKLFPKQYDLITSR